MSKIVFTMGTQTEFSQATESEAIYVRDRCAALLVIHRSSPEAAVIVETYLATLKTLTGA